MHPTFLLPESRAAVLLSLAHLVSTPLLPLLHTLLLHHLRFSFPATLSLLQHSSISVSLLFWALFSLYRPFPYKPLTLLPLALTALPATVLPLLALSRVSLAVVHAASVFATPLLATVEAPCFRNLLALACALAGFAALARLDPVPSRPGTVVAALSGAGAAGHRIAQHRLLPDTHGSELQLQLGLRTLLSALLICVTPLLDDYDPTSEMSIFNYAWDEGAAILFLSTGLLAFLGFVSRRASAASLHPTAYAALTHLVSLCVFAVHFVVFEHPFEVPHALAVALVMAGAVIVGEQEADKVVRNDAMRWRSDLEVQVGESDEEVIFDWGEERRYLRGVERNASQASGMVVNEPRPVALR